MSDYPLLRQVTICPLCVSPKDQGLIVCWPCHHKEKRAHAGAYGPETTAKLARFEDVLRLTVEFEQAMANFMAETDEHATKH